MSRFVPLSDTFSVSPQLTESDVQAAADLGFKHIVCNRPDGEDDGQPDFQTVSDLAVKLGMSTHHIPFDNYSLSGAVIDAMQQTLDSLDGPVLAYCRSGTRCTVAWSALERRAGKDLDGIQATTSSAGYDLSAQRSLIEALAG